MTNKLYVRASLPSVVAMLDGPTIGIPFALAGVLAVAFNEAVAVCGGASWTAFWCVRSATAYLFIEGSTVTFRNIGRRVELELPMSARLQKCVWNSRSGRTWTLLPRGRRRVQPFALMALGARRERRMQALMEVFETDHRVKPRR